MRKESDQDVAAIARRRLELLGRELAGHAGADQNHDQEHEPDLDDIDGPGARSVLVPDRGRHSLGHRPRRPAGPRWLQDRLPAGLLDRVTLTRPHLVLVAAVVAAALAVTAWTALRAAPTAVPAPVAHTSPATTPLATPLATLSAAAAQSTQAAPAADVSGAGLVVDVAGKVRHPGVATLPPGSRVIDAIRHAGGARRGVDLSDLNLARPLVDGEQILVGRPAAAGVAAGDPAPSAGTSLVDLNTATPEQLDLLPGVGPVTAQKIVQWRTEHGSFTSVDDLLEVDGIGDKTMADIAPHVTL